MDVGETDNTPSTKTMTSQKSITKEDFAKAMKQMVKAENFKRSKYNGSRISGWGKSTAGVEYAFPRFDWSYQRNYRKIASYSSEPFEEMEVEYRKGEYQHEADRAKEESARFKEVFKQYVPADVYEVNEKGSFVVRVSNPFYNN